MIGKRGASLVGISLAFAVAAFWLIAADPAAPQRRDALMKTYQAGNFKDAYDRLRKQTLSPDADPKLVGPDLQLATQCLMQLGRDPEIEPAQVGRRWI